jgi:hypothetical protein
MGLFNVIHAIIIAAQKWDNARGNQTWQLDTPHKWMV